MLFKNIIKNKKHAKNKKGGVQMILEFVFLLPFLLILVLLLFDVLKFYYTYNIAQLAAYHSAYNFSMTTNVKSSMEEGQKMLHMIGINQDRFENDDVTKAYLYKYNKDTKSFGTKYKIREDKTSVSCYGDLVGLTCHDYDNQRMRDREVWGVQFEIQNRLLSTAPLEVVSGGTMRQVKIPVEAHNHVFEIQRYENDLSS